MNSSAALVRQMLEPLFAINTFLVLIFFIGACIGAFRMKRSGVLKYRDGTVVSRAENPEQFAKHYRFACGIAVLSGIGVVLMYLANL